jgi:hypothetical protein
MGMGIGDWGLGIGDWAQSPIPNPQSPIPNPHPHLSSSLFKNLNKLKIIKKFNYLNQKRLCPFFLLFNLKFFIEK